MLYGNTGDNNLRLSRTIIRLGEEPILVNKFAEDGTLTYQYLKDGENRREKLKDIKEPFNLEPVPLGYCNYKGSLAFYISRLPVRRSKQGTCDENTYVEGGAARLSLIEFSDVRNMILGRYPKFEEVLKRLTKRKDEPSTVAFSRRFALSAWDGKRLALMYKNRVVGSVSYEGEIELADANTYLSELLEKSIYRSASYA